MARIMVPREMSDFPILQLALELEKVKFDEEFIIDFANVHFARPFGTLLLAEVIRNIVTQRKERGLQTKAENHNIGRNAHSYLCHVGFFKHMGLNYGSEPGSAWGSSTYVPIEVITKQSLEQSGSARIQDAIVRESMRLSNVILGHDVYGDDHPVPYTFREVIRNTFEHGNTEECVVCAQKYRDRDIEIAIFDRGRGLRHSLAEKFDIADDREALRLAVQPGISRSDVDKSDDSDYWANSGFGLYVLSELAQRTGDFIMCSGKSAMRYNNGEKKFADVPFNGTAIKLLIVKQPGIDLVALRRQIITEGEQISPGKRKASGASKGI